MNSHQIEEKILALLKNNGHRSYRPKEIAKRLSLFDNTDYRTFREVLETMAAEGKIARIKGGRFTYQRRPKQATGVLSISPRGFGFVVLDTDQSEVYVRSLDMGTAFHGDHVEISLRRPASGDRKREAVVDRVLERRKTTTVGTFESHGGFGLVSSDDTRFLHDVRVDLESFGGATSGDKVLVRIDRFDNPEGRPEGTVVKVLGSPRESGVAEKALALTLGIPIEFPEFVLSEAASVAAAVTPQEIGQREDFRAHNVFTIDPVDARDFDDAVHVLKIDKNTWEVGVHIADVAHYVQDQSEIDKEAFQRGTSVYMVEHVFPMLPEHLSNEICSLQPDSERLTMSCIVRLSSSGDVIGSRFVNSVIRSKARLSYEEAEAILDGETDHELGDDIRQAGKLARTLTKRRFQEGSIDFDTPEAHIVLDDSGHPIDIVLQTRLAAHRLIEEFMLLANRLVAGYMTGKTENTPPFIYRIHEEPDRERIAALSTYVGAFGVELRHDRGSVDLGELNKLLVETRGTPRGAVIAMAALRSMAKAKYSIGNRGHFGLGFDQYTHFTSPIRRYPDLMVHRLLKRRLLSLAPLVDKKHLEEISNHSSERERAAEEAERESVKLKKVQFLQDHIGEQHSGYVTGATSFGVFVRIDEWLVEGLVHVRDMDGFYEYDEQQYALIGSRGNKIMVGDTVEVIIVDADEQTREIDFTFVPGQGL